MGILNSWQDRLLKRLSNLEDDISDATLDVILERHRQIREEGWSPEHDDTHELGELAMAATCYAEMSVCHYAFPDQFDILNRWPWSHEWWKPETPRRDLVRAAALLLAEIERLDRKNKKTESL